MRGAHECHEEIEEDRKVERKVLPRDLRLKQSSGPEIFTDVTLTYL